jgi:hypothetical protein
MLPLPSSYRDNDGFVFKHEGKIFRYIHPRYYTPYSHLMQSGLYLHLTTKKWLIPHEEIPAILQFGIEDGKILLPEQIPFISYPYEWSFAMWQDAALLTLNIAAAALKNNLFLKDATPFNIQFLKGKPIFIDTLSFEIYEEGNPWIAYRQFCESFLAPLILMQYCNHDSYKLFTVYPNGIPLEVLTTLLPKKCQWNLNVYLHIYLQAKISENKKKKTNTKLNFSKQKQEVLLQGLKDMVRKLSPKKTKTTWDDYYTDTILGQNYLNAKNKLVQTFLSNVEFSTMIDLGANDGYFSLLYKNTEKQIVAVDGDANCINDLYCKIRDQKITNILPCINTLNNPSPAIGWNNKERDSFNERMKADLVLALALVHHLAIACNVPLNLIADWLEERGKYLLIEFVPKTDEKVQLLLQNREDIFDDYTIENFEIIFSKKYQIILQEKITGTERMLYLMKRKNETA